MQASSNTIQCHKEINCISCMQADSSHFVGLLAVIARSTLNKKRELGDVEVHLRFCRDAPFNNSASQSKKINLYCGSDLPHVPALTVTRSLSKCASRLRCPQASQRSLHNAPIFRLLLKVAVNGTHQCDFLNF